MELIEEATKAGARLQPACAVLGVSARTYQRWVDRPGDDDKRAGPKTAPSNKLTVAERRRLLEVVNREEFRDLRKSFADGTITAEQLRDNAKVLREEMETELANVLTDEQFAALEEALAEHRAEVTQRRIDGLADGVERRTEFLTNVLELDSGQAAAVSAVLQGTLSERQSILEQLRDGQIEIEDALYAGYQLATATADLIRAELTAEYSA